MYAPILLFVYNRPEHTRRVIESLQTNAEAIESRLFIYADQARNEADLPLPRCNPPRFRSDRSEAGLLRFR